MHHSHSNPQKGKLVLALSQLKPQLIKPHTPAAEFLAARCGGAPAVSSTQLQSEETAPHTPGTRAQKRGAQIPKATEELNDKNQQSEEGRVTHMATDREIRGLAPTERRRGYPMEGSDPRRGLIRVGTCSGKFVCLGEAGGERRRPRG